MKAQNFTLGDEGDHHVAPFELQGPDRRGQIAAHITSKQAKQAPDVFVGPDEVSD